MDDYGKTHWSLKLITLLVLSALLSGMACVLFENTAVVEAVYIKTMTADVTDSNGKLVEDVTLTYPAKVGDSVYLEQDSNGDWLVRP